MSRQWSQHVGILVILTLGCGEAPMAVDRSVSVSKETDSVVVDPPAISVGRVDVADGKGQGSCRIWNRGDASVKVREVTPSCGCSKAELTSDEIAPGSFVTMTVSLSSGQVGHKSSRVIVSFHDSPYVARIPVEGCFVRPFWMEPASICVRCGCDSTKCSVPLRFFFAERSVAESIDPAAIRVASEWNSQLTMQGVTLQTGYACLKATLEMQFAATEELSTTVRLEGIDPDGPVSLPVSIRRNLQESGISPKYSAIGYVAAGETRPIHLAGPTAVLNSVSHAELTGAVGIACDLASSADEDELTVDLTFQESCPAGVVQASLQLWSKDGTKVHEMKVFANVAAAKPSRSNSSSLRSN